MCCIHLISSMVGNVCASMAVVASNNYGWIVCHKTFMNKVYKRTKCLDDVASYELDPILFDIYEPFRHTKCVGNIIDEEVILVKIAYESLCELFKAKNLGTGNKLGDNKNARTLAKKFYCSTSHYTATKAFGGNTGEESIVGALDDEKYLFPPKCTFYSYDINVIHNHFHNKLFHFILMDPPWWNKFIRRKRKANASLGYSMLYDDDLKNIPIDRLLHVDGIIGVWCTSAPSHINTILTMLFPAWGIEYISQWFWLKVTRLGKPICAFSESHGKQPYERIIFGIKNNSNRKLPNPEKNKVFMSVPSAIHSHKPPICELIKPYIPEHSECLELFSRYLLPEWTSYGNEVLKLQHLSLYVKTIEP